MKIVHIADIHGDDKYYDEMVKGCDFIIRKIDELNPCPVLTTIAGDIFDDREIKLDSKTCKYLIEWVDDLSSYSPVAIVRGTPKHEGTASEAFMKEGLVGYRVFTASTPIQLFIFNDKEIYPGDDHLPNREPIAIASMIPTPTKKFMQGTNDEIAIALNGLFAGFGAEAAKFNCPHIIIGHFSVRGAAISDTQVMIGRDIEISKAQLQMARYDLCCLGHIHLAQDMGSNIFYSGDIFQKNYGEAGQDKGFYIHTLDKPRGSLEPVVDRYALESEFIKTPTRKLVNIKQDFTIGDESFDLESITATPGDDIKGAHIKVSLSAFQDESVKFNKDQIIEHLKMAGAADVQVNIAHIPREITRSENILDLNYLADKITENARIKDEKVPEGVTEIAFDMETFSREEMLERVTNGCYKRTDPGSVTNGG